MTRLRALLATLRIANAPSVVSNVWLGFMLGWGWWGGDPFEAPRTTWFRLGMLCAAGLLAYFAGNLANDWFDRGWDRRHRPERALPAGVFGSTSYLLAALVTATASIALAAQASLRSIWAMGTILALIAIYTWLHKRTRWAVIPMGLCRAGLYVLGFLPYVSPFPVEDDFNRLSHGLEVQEWWMGHAFVTTHALGLLAYIAGLSLAARYESTEHPPHGMVLLSRAMLFLPLAAMSAWWMPEHPLTASLALLPFALWLALSLTRFRRPVPRFVSALLAGIPLVDFIAALPLVASMIPSGGQYLFGPVPPAAILLVPPVAFLLALLLQKAAPAT